MRLIPSKRTIIVTCLVCLSFTAGAFASDGVKKVAAFLRPDYTVLKNGQKVNLEQPVLVYQNSSYLPLKAIGELLGVTVTWDNQTRSINIQESPSQQPSTGANSNTSSNVIVSKDEILLEDVIVYTLTYKNKDYPVLVNYYKETMYFSVKDINRLSIPLGGLTVYPEKFSKETYIKLEDVQKRWDETPLTNLLDDPVIRGESDEDKIKALTNFPVTYGKVLSITKLSANNEYKILAEIAKRKFAEYTVTLRQSTTGSWYFSTVKNFIHE